MFDDYWINYGKIEALIGDERRIIRSFKDYLIYRGLSTDICNDKAVKRKENER